VSGSGKKKKVMTKSEHFQSYSRAITYCGYLASDQNVSIFTTHIKKVIARLHFFILISKELKNNNRSEISQRSEISLDTGSKAH